MLDVDGFKCINDTHGHISGDRILRNVGEAIVKHFQSPCCDCFRIGGDEFVLLMENAEQEQIKELVAVLNEDLLESDGVTVSYGFSIVNFNSSKPFESAFENADAVMYSNKRKRTLTNDDL